MVTTRMIPAGVAVTDTPPEAVTAGTATARAMTAGAVVFDACPVAGGTATANAMTAAMPANRPAF